MLAPLKLGSDDDVWEAASGERLRDAAAQEQELRGEASPEFYHELAAHADE